MTRDCDLFMEDPERHAAHGESCADCRAFLDEMKRFEAKLADVKVIERPLASSIQNRLPLAPWEGAAHRAWLPVLVVLLAVTATAIGLMMAAGVSPLEWMRGTVTSSAAIARGGMTLLQSAPKIFGGLSPAFRATIVVVFVLVNLLLVALLRRAPKGYDAQPR